MHLTRFTDYSLRVLVYAAMLPDGELTNIDEIAAFYGISSNHLMKSVHKLGQLEVLQTIRGRNGGLRLAKLPEDIHIGWIVSQTEKSWRTVECLNEGRTACIPSQPCQLNGIFQKALEAYLAVLDEYTLADVIRNRNQFPTLFQHQVQSTE